MRALWICTLLVTAGWVGCIGNEGVSEAEEPAGASGAPNGTVSPELAFAEPVELTTDGLRGFEPSIEVAPSGTVYVTAHKANRTHEDDRLASWLWYSQDDGETWNELSSPLDVHEKLTAQEGDVAVDSEGRLYLVDTYVADVTVSVWSAADEGPEWEQTRPAGPVAHKFNDRPWIAAAGDRTAYYLAHGVGVQLADGARDAFPASRSVLHRSTDGGRTFEPVHGFNAGGSNSGASFCQLATQPDEADHVAVSCSTGSSSGNGVVSFESDDGGETWTQSSLPAFEKPASSTFPSVPAIGPNGTAYHGWVTDEIGVPTGQSDDEPGHLYLARSTGEGYDTIEVPLPNGSLATHWIAAGDPGTVAILVHAADTLDTDDGADWYPYVVRTDNANVPDPDWQVTRLSQEPVATDSAPPADFSQIAIGPDNRVHVAFGAEDHACEVADGCYESRQADSVYYTHQLAANATPAKPTP